MIVAMYADAGISKGGTAPIGAYAYCLVDEKGVRQQYGFNLIVPEEHGLTGIGCNTAEFFAFLRGLEALPDGWSGKVHTDSNTTLNRFFHGWAMRGLPYDWVERGSAALKRLGTLTPVLLGGHPSPADRKRGDGLRIRPGKAVLPWSDFNVWCDEVCTDLLKPYKETKAK